MKVQAGMHAGILEDVFEGIVEAIHEADDLEIYTSGATNMLKYPELIAPGQTTALLDTLVEKKALVELVDETVKDEEKHGIQVYIGNETPVQSLRECSIVTATYELEDGGTGTVGIVGPKRMDYRRVVKTLRSLTDDLNEIFRSKDV
jgi:heat-inducible transcriptional repressor